MYKGGFSRQGNGCARQLCHSCDKAGAVQGVASKVMVTRGVKDRDYSWWKLKSRFASFLESLGNTCTIKRDEVAI